MVRNVSFADRLWQETDRLCAVAEKPRDACVPRVSVGVCIRHITMCSRMRSATMMKKKPPAEQRTLIIKEQLFTEELTINEDLIKSIVDGGITLEQSAIDEIIQVCTGTLDECGCGKDLVGIGSVNPLSPTVASDKTIYQSMKMFKFKEHTEHNVFLWTLFIYLFMKHASYTTT